MPSESTGGGAAASAVLDSEGAGATEITPAIRRAEAAGAATKKSVGVQGAERTVLWYCLGGR